MGFSIISHQLSVKKLIAYCLLEGLCAAPAAAPCKPRPFAAPVAGTEFRRLRGGAFRTFCLFPIPWLLIRFNALLD